MGNYSKAVALFCLCALSAVAETLIPARSISLSAATPVIETPILSIDTQTATLRVTLQRPTTLQPLTWGATGRVQIEVFLYVDGRRQHFTGRATGGIVSSLDGEVTHYVLECTPTWGWFGARSGATRRLGETRSSTYQFRVRLTRLRGDINTELAVESTVAPAPNVPFRSSVAFDAATSAKELSGDGVITISHTATGSDLGAFLGVANSSGSGSQLGSATYDGNAMDEEWDENWSPEANFGHAGYSIVGSLSGAKNVVSTLAASPTEHYAGVISFTGVHQTTQVGTPQTTFQAGGTSISVTVTSVDSDDMVVDSLYYFPSSATSPSAGANQTVRNTESDPFNLEFRQSTQDGGDGGQMSYTGTSLNNWGLGAIAFKPSAAAPTATSQYINVLDVILLPLTWRLP